MRTRIIFNSLLAALVVSVAQAAPETAALSYTLRIHPEIKRAFHANDSIEIRSITGSAQV